MGALLAECDVSILIPSLYCILPAYARNIQGTPMSSPNGHLHQLDTWTTSALDQKWLAEGVELSWSWQAAGKETRLWGSGDCRVERSLIDLVTTMQIFASSSRSETSGWCLRQRRRQFQDTIATKLLCGLIHGTGNHQVRSGLVQPLIRSAIEENARLM